MNKAEEQLLKKCIKQCLICRIERARFDPRPMFCVPIKMSDSLLAVHFVDDFLYNGIKIIRKKDITKVLVNEPEKFLQMIFADMNIPLPEVNINLDLTDYFSVFKKNAEQLVAVECEKIGFTDFYLGDFVYCNDIFIQVQCVNSCGEWYDYFSCIPLSEITCINFDSRYQRAFSQYIQ